MDYKTLMGYGKKKKKVAKEQQKPKKTLLDGIKQELNEWNQIPPSEKRWSKSFDGDNGLTEFEETGGKDNINENPAMAAAARTGFATAIGTAAGEKASDKLMSHKGDDEEEIEEGPAGDYEPYIHAINQNYKRYWDSVKDFEKQLVKKGMKKQAHNIHGFYTKLVSKFHSWFGKFVRKLM